MFSKNKKINSPTKLSLLLIIILSIFFVKLQAQANDLDDLIDDYCKGVSEEECDEYKNELGDTEDELDDLEKKLKNAEKLAKLKREQAKTLKNQVGLLNLEISTVQSKINGLEGEIVTLEDKIENILTEIKKKDENIKNSKKNLGELLRNYQKLNQNLGLTFVSSDSTLGDVFSQSDYLSKISTEINMILKIIKEERETLKENREELEIEKGKLDNKKTEVEERRSSLSSKKYEKNSLLNRTEGEEAQYQALINKIESQMKQLLIDVSSLTAAEQGELNDILKNADKPKEGKASESWYYSQIDSKWKNKSLGGSSYTIGDSGCAITSIAMVGKSYGNNIRPSDLTSSNFFSDRKGQEGFIDWYEPPKHFDLKLKLKTGHATSNFNNSRIKDYLKNDVLVIAYISAGGPGHYVVIHGYDNKRKDFVVHDPYWGPNLLLETSKKLVATLHKRSTVVDQIIVYEED